MRGNNGNNYTDDEKAIIIAAYQENANNKSGWLQELSTLISRPKANISRFARENGLSNRQRSSIKETINCFVCGEATTNRRYCSVGCSNIGAGMTRRGQKLWASRNHPKGMLGKTHTPEVKKQMSIRVKKAWKDPNYKMNSKEYRQQLSNRASLQMVKRIQEQPTSVYSRTQKGWADFPSGKRYFFRSGWEVRYANYLEMLLKGKAILDWQYEVDTFWFEAIRRGVRSYTPDFKVFFKDGSIEYHEVKGWMDSKSATKLKRMKKYYPDVKVIVIGAQEMKNI